MVHFRLPHHTEPATWFDRIAFLQLTGVGVAIWLVRGSRLSFVLCMVSFCSAALTWLQLDMQSDSLASCFRGASSAILVPIALAIILAKVVLAIERWVPPFGSQKASLVNDCCHTIGVAMAVSGVILMAGGWAYRTNAQALPMLDYVRDHRRSGDVYLVPPSGLNSKVECFRLYTGASIFADFKSIPYKDVEVLEWHRRFRQVQQIYARREWNRMEAIAALEKEGITHVVISSDRAIDSRLLDAVYHDRAYSVYRFARQKAQPTHTE